MQSPRRLVGGSRRRNGTTEPIDRRVGGTVAMLAAELDIEEPGILVDDVRRFNKELEKLYKTPRDTETEVEIKLYNIVGQNDELMPLLISDAFAKSKWKTISMELVPHESLYEGNVTTLSFLGGLARNPVVKEWPF